MGCHTWFAVKDHRTIEQARAIWIAKREAWIEDYQSHIDNPDKPPFEDTPMEDKLHYMAVYKRQLQMVKKGLCNVAVMNDQPEHSHYIPDKGLYIYGDDLPHDVFRVGKYPEDRLFSFEETMQYLENNDTNVSYGGEAPDSPLRNANKEKSIARLKQFWDQYPDGLIRFG